VSGLIDLLRGTWLVDVAILVIAVELVVVLAAGSSRRVAAHRTALAATLVAGTFLLVALRLLLAGGDRVWLVPLLTGALAAHLADVYLRLRR
jgi:hypothetical protein